VRTGARQLLVRETRESWIGAPDYADELWSRATVARPGPDRAYDPRWAAGAGVALAGGLALLLWRRRARR
jgi:LPXTG-motif cell wall-anchored protein